MIDPAGSVTVVQPNEDGSYWRKIVRNKMIRMKEARRVKAAKLFASKVVPEEEEPHVVSSWGPYTSIVGTAKTTGVAGLTTQAKIAKAWDQLGGGRVAAWREMADELTDVFKRLGGGSGQLTKAQLREAVKKLDPSCDEGWIIDMMTLADTDRDGSVSLEEFARLMLWQRIRTDA